jgi:transposase-like protein
MKQARHSEEERRRIVGEWRHSGQGIIEFCESQGIAYRSFKRWQAEQGELADSGGAFLPVLVSPGPARHAAPCRIRVGDVVVIECESESSAIAVETAIRAAVAACGPM